VISDKFWSRFFLKKYDFQNIRNRKFFSDDQDRLSKGTVPGTRAGTSQRGSKFSIYYYSYFIPVVLVQLCTLGTSEYPVRG
jgi:hypothetical protein